MLIIPKSDFLAHRQKSIDLITYGSVFIYPTDTIYGLGCDARSYALVRRVRQIKQSLDQPFSVIAPSKGWIKENLAYKKSFDNWLDRLPGPYTLIMKMKNEYCVAKEVTAGSNSLGVRIPKNWFSDIIAEANIPVVTTSVNVHGSKPMASLLELPESIKRLVDFAIDDGVIAGKPSTIVNLTKSPPEIIERK
jgi:L-threonylcarbamoyladenylate synthase